MSIPGTHPDTAQPSIPQLLSTWAGNFRHQTHKAFSEMTLQGYIRLVIIIGAYALLRPYLMKIGAKLQERAHERDSAATDQPTAALDGNDLRGGKKVAIPGVDSDDEEEEETVAGDWGKTARLRQRKFIRQQLEEHERKLREDAEALEDKDIEEFLVD